MEQFNVVERLKAFMELDCKSIAGFAKMAGVDASNFAKMLDGRLNITRQTLKKIAAAHSINLVWLETGKGDMFADYGTTANDYSIESDKTNTDSIDVYEKLVAELRADKARLIAQNDNLIAQNENLIQIQTNKK